MPWRYKATPGKERPLPNAAQTRALFQQAGIIVCSIYTSNGALRANVQHLAPSALISLVYSVPGGLVQLLGWAQLINAPGAPIAQVPCIGPLPRLPQNLTNIANMYSVDPVLGYRTAIYVGPRQNPQPPQPGPVRQSPWPNGDRSTLRSFAQLGDVFQGFPNA